MKKFLSAFLALSLVMAGCTSTDTGTDSQTQTESEGLVITDDLGRTVTVESADRVACLIGSFADLYSDAGGKDNIVAAADDAFDDFDLDLDAANLGGVKDINLETLADTQPDLVIASSRTDAQTELLDTLEAMNMTVLYFDVSSFDDYLRVLKTMTEITGDEQAYETNGISQQEEIDAIRNETHDTSPTILALRATSKSVKALGTNSVLGQMLEDLKTVNPAGDVTSAELSLEQIVEANPEKIFIVLQGDEDKANASLQEQLLDNPVWQSLDAVKNGQVYYLDGRLYNLKPNASWAKAEKDLETLVYGS